MKAGDFYISDDPKIFEEQQRAIRLSAMFLAAYAEDGVAAQKIARELFGGFGETAYVRPPVYLDYGSHITVGARTFINAGFTALDVARIRSGRTVRSARTSNYSRQSIPSSHSPAEKSWRRRNR